MEGPGAAPIYGAGEVKKEVGAPPRERFTERELVGRLMARAADGATLYVDSDKFPGPSSYSPIDGYQPSTPIPATIYLWRAESEGGETPPPQEQQLQGVVHRSGCDPEPFGAAPGSSLLTALWRMPYADRVGYMDATGFKVIVARVSQIDIVVAASDPEASSSSSAMTKEAKKKNSRSALWIGILAGGIVCALIVAYFLVLRAQKTAPRIL